ncbi:MAG: hypothetical protein JOZ54_22015 [Acidobacteria bacterium]|nr:hypothetical protein [Acidobacteriota bacterium]
MRVLLADDHSLVRVAMLGLRTAPSSVSWYRSRTKRRRLLRVLLADDHSLVRVAMPIALGNEEEAPLARAAG